MGRQHRFDAPGVLHHVMNRGVGGRPIFERPDNYRYFKTLLACSVRAERLRVHGFVLMPNHFHLLVESCDGNLGESMRRLQGYYAARFNRTRNLPRPGHLLGSRYKSFVMEDAAYLFTASRYADLNPVKAGLCRWPWEYPHGSAACLLADGPPPRWLTASTMNRMLDLPDGTGVERRAAYGAMYGDRTDLRSMEVIARCLEGRATSAPLDLDGLLGGDIDRRRAWLARQAMIGDGTRVSSPVADVQSVREAVRHGRRQAPNLKLGPRSSLWDVLEVALLRDLAATSLRSIAGIIGLSSSAAAKRYDKHRSAMRRDPRYASRAARIAGDALEACHGPNALAIARESVRRLASKVEESA